MKPLLLIDIDGVLNPYYARECPEGFESHSIFGFDVRLCTRHGKWLSKLSEKFELVWATMWEWRADEMIAPIIGLSRGIEHISFESAVSSRSYSPTYKLPSVTEYLERRGLPAVWIDDELGPDALSWASRRTTRDGVPTLFLPIARATGLTDRHVATIHRFHRRLTAPQG